jgi:hypothetical protein
VFWRKVLPPSSGLKDGDSVFLQNVDTRPHGVKAQKINIIIFSTMRTSNLTQQYMDSRVKSFLQHAIQEVLGRTNSLNFPYTCLLFAALEHNLM